MRQNPLKKFEDPVQLKKFPTPLGCGASRYLYNKSMRYRMDRSDDGDAHQIPTKSLAAHLESTLAHVPKRTHTTRAFPSQQSHSHRGPSSAEVGDELGAEEVEDAGCSELNLLSCSVSS